VANHAENEQRKKEDDKKKKKRRRRVRGWTDENGARGQRGKKMRRKMRRKSRKRKELMAPRRPSWEDLVGEDGSAGDGASLGGPFSFHEGEVGHSAPSKPSYQREVSKRPHFDEAQPGLGGPPPKHRPPVAPR
jgi:hypothetical protein